MSAMAKSQKAKGDGFMLDANKIRNKSAWFASSKERNAESAAELYEQAANAYKVGGFHQEAGDAYMEAAKLYRDKIGNMHEASKDLSQAALSYQKGSPTDAVDAYTAAVALLVDAGKLTAAAKLCRDFGLFFEGTDGGLGTDYEETVGKSSVVLAIEAYAQAAELYELENQSRTAQQQLEKVAELCSATLDPPDLIRAAKIYDDIGRSCLDSPTLKFNVKGYALKCVMCHLANGDAIAAEQIVSRYNSLDYTFEESREGRLATALVECVNGYDADGFATACAEYDRIKKLSNWETAMLLKAKRSIADDEGEEDEEVDLT